MPIDRTETFGHDGVSIAYRRSIGRAGQVSLVWLGGFHSDMAGEKTTALHTVAEAEGHGFLRFDYMGHGESGGRFEDGTIGRWRSDALAAIDALTDGPLVLVGSSMGGWMALLAALARPDRVKGIVLLAPAPDFTERLIWARFNDAQRKQVMETGSWTRPSDYDPSGYPITRALIEDGRSWSIMNAAEIAIDVPVRILHGGLDPDVPWEHSFELQQKLRSKDVVWSLIKDGDHRLSRPEDIARMVATVLQLASDVR